MFEAFKAKRRLDDLEERFAKLERDFHALEMEWSNAYDKMRQTMGRIAKRTALLREDTQPDETREEPSAPERPSSLTAKQIAINERILARRNRMGGGAA